MVHCRRKWQSTPVFLPGESHGQRSLASYGPQGHRESDTTEATEHTCMSVKMKQLSQSENPAQLWMSLMAEVKSDAVKSNIA